MEELIFVGVCLSGEGTPAPEAEHIKTKEEAIVWLEQHQEYTPNEEGESEHEFKSKYILLEITKKND
jgi:hypothetical protein